MVEGKKDEGAEDPIKILFEEALEKQRNTMMDKFSQILQRLPTSGTSTSSTSTNRSAKSWTNPIPDLAEFPPPPPWRNLTQWIPLIPKEEGMVQVDIGGHPPIPFGL